MKITFDNVRSFLNDNVSIDEKVIVTIGRKTYEAEPSGLTFNAEGQAQLKFAAIEAPKAMQASGTRKAVKGGK